MADQKETKKIAGEIPSVEEKSLDEKEGTGTDAPNSILDEKNEVPKKDDIEAQTSKEKEEELDPNLVTWDGPNDPENPKNWRLRRKWAAAAVVSIFTFMSPVASTMLAPALADMAHDLHIVGSIQIQLVFSVFMLAFAFGPLVLGPLSEVYGRVIVLQLANAFFLCFTLGCGFAQTKGQMIAFRFLSGLGACAPQAIGSAVLGDMFTAEERGKAIALYTLMPLLGPVAGPLGGGWIAEKTTWRWCFWSVVIFGVCAQGFGLFFFRETYAPTLLKRKAVKLRRETNNPDLKTEVERRGFNWHQMLEKALIRPFRMLATQTIIQFLSIYMSFVYGLMWIMLSTFPGLWTGPYHESPGIGSLNYISLAIGFFMSSQFTGRMNDFIYARMKKRSPDGKGQPEFRVPMMIPGILLVSSGFFIYGWTAQYHTHWIGPNIGAFIFALGSIMVFTSMLTYIIDSYQMYAASAVSATVVMRSLAAFGFPLFAPDMYDALGYGWGNSLLGFLGIGLGIPGAGIIWFFGPRMRGMSKYAPGQKPK